YDHTNYHELYNKIKKETCSIRLQFIKMHKPVVKKIEEDIIDFSHNVKYVIDMIKTMSRDIFSNCGELTNSCCEKLENTSYDRLLQLIAASNSIGTKHPHEMIKRCCEYNDKIEIFFSIIRSFTIDFNKLYEISDVVKQIKC